MAKDKKKDKKKKDKKSKDDGLSTIASDASLAQTLASNASTMLPPQQNNGPVFSGGQMFERYAKNGAMTPRAFLQMVQNEGLQPVHSRPMTVAPPTQRIGGGMRDAQADFEVGRLFQRFGKGGGGNITSNEFKQMMQQLAMEGKWRQNSGINNNLNGMSGGNATYASTSAAARSVRPPELPMSLPPAPETERIRAELNAQASSINPMAATELHMLQMNLLSKKEHLLQQMRFVRARAEEVQSVRRAIERETLADTETILHRLRGAEALKLSLLKHDMDQLQHDVDEIDGFAKMLKADTLNNSLSSNSNSKNNNSNNNNIGLDHSVLPMSTRSKYLEMCAEAERIVSKPFKTSIDVRADDFDRETVDRANLASQVEAANEAAAVKDQMVWMLLREREEYKEKEKLYADEINNISTESAKEIEEWVRLTDNFREKLNVAKSRIRELEAQNGNGQENTEATTNEENTENMDGPRSIKTPAKKSNNVKGDGGWV
jgi:hypothetical protein